MFSITNATRYGSLLSIIWNIATRRLDGLPNLVVEYWVSVSESEGPSGRFIHCSWNGSRLESFLASRSVFKREGGSFSS